MVPVAVPPFMVFYKFRKHFLDEILVSVALEYLHYRPCSERRLAVSAVVPGRLRIDAVDDHPFRGLVVEHGPDLVHRRIRIEYSQCSGMLP